MSRRGGSISPVGTDRGQAFIYDRSNLVLQDPKAPLLLQQHLQRAQLAKAQKAKDLSKAGSSLQKFMNESNEYWYRHDNELQKRMDSVYNMGAEILAAQADPFTSTDQASTEFRRKKDELVRMANFSNQLKDLHGEYFKKIDQGGKEGGKYTDESKQAVAQYFETPLEELVNENREPPRLELSQPAFSVLEYDTGLAKDISSAKKDGVSDADIITFAAKSLENQDINDAIHTQMQRLGESGRRKITAMAQNQGMAPAVFLRYQQMKPHFRDNLESFNFVDVEKQMRPGLSSSRIERGDVTKAVTRLLPNAAEENARLIVVANPKYVQAGVAAGRFGSPTNNFDENVEAAIEWNKKRLLSQSKNVFERSEDEGAASQFGGASREDYEANRALWLEAIRSGDPERAREAGDYLKGIQLEDGSRIEQAVEPPSTSVMLGGADRGVQFQTVRTYKQDGEIKEERKPFGVGSIEDTDEFLLRLYDQAFSGPAKKQMFGDTQRVETNGPFIPGQPSQPDYLNILK